MNNGTKRIISFATAVFLLTSAVSFDLIRPLRASGPSDVPPKSAVIPAQVLSATSADAGMAGLEQLDQALSDENSSRTAEICDTLTQLLETELSEKNVSAEILDDPLIEERQQQYLNEIAVRAGRTRAALDAVRNGSTDPQDLAVIREAFTERTASHRSDATPSEALYLNGTKTEEGTLSEQSAQPLSAAPPTDEEKHLSGDMDIPEALRSLAAELGSAKEIYHYIRKMIVYEAYAGSKKGAAVTLDQLGGNDIDQARLLIAMLRAIDVPARYVTGMIEVTAEQAIAITGAADAESAGRILESRHKNVKGITNQGVLIGYQMEHTWAEAYVPYTDYRGVGANAGQPVWIPLDPSFKTLTVEKQETTLTLTENDTAMLDRMDEAAADQPVIFSDYRRPDTKLDLYLRTIAPIRDDYLPASLPYTVLSVKARYASLPDAMKDTLSIAINGEELLNEPLTALYFKQITVSYIPATASDEQLLSSDDKLTEVPSYLVQMLPVVTVRGDNGVDRYVGTQSAALGAIQQMTTTLKNEGDTTILTDDIFSGSVYAFNLNFQHIMPADIEYSYGLLCAAQKNADESNYTSPEILGAMLDYAGKSYFAYCDYDAARYEKVFDICRNRQLGLCITGYEFKSKDTLGIVDQLEDGAFFIDVAYNNYSAVSYAGSKRAETGFNTALSEMESFHEGKIWEVLTDHQLSGISTVSVMNTAYEQNIPTRLIMAQTVEESLAECHVSESVKDEVRDFVNKGMIVELVADTVMIGDWSGTAYIARDMRTGAASYMLSGGTAGGSSSAFDRMFMINRALYNMTLSLSAMQLCQTAVKIYMPSPSTKIDGVITGLNTAKMLGEACTMYFDNMSFVFDYAMEGDAMLDRYLEFTLENLKRTEEYLQSCMYGAAGDIVGGALNLCKLAYPLLEDAFEAANIAFDSANTLGTSIPDVVEQYQDLSENMDLSDSDYEEWFEEYNQSCLEKTLDLLLNLLKSFVGRTVD